MDLPPPPEVLIMRENDPPYLGDSLVRANGYAFMSKTYWRDFDPAEQPEHFKRSIRELLKKAKSFDSERDWDRVKSPGGYVGNSAFLGGYAVVVPLEMLLDD